MSARACGLDPDIFPHLHLADDPSAPRRPNRHDPRGGRVPDHGHGSGRGHRRHGRAAHRRDRGRSDHHRLVSRRLLALAGGTRPGPGCVELRHRAVLSSAVHRADLSPLCGRHRAAGIRNVDRHRELVTDCGWVHRARARHHAARVAVAGRGLSDRGRVRAAGGAPRGQSRSSGPRREGGDVMTKDGTVVRARESWGAGRRRRAMARTLVVWPRLLLLDEPLSGLDAQPRARMRLELARLHREVGITTLYVTHDQAEALSLSTRIGVVSGGSLIQEGKPEEIYWKPRNAFVAEFVGAANLVPVRVTELREMGVVVETAGGARLPVSSGAHTWTAGARALLCLRPEALRVEEAALAPGGIPGTVAGHVFEGSRQLYDVDIPGATVRVEMITSALVGRSFRLGDEVKIEVSPETSVLLPDERPAP